MLAQRCCFQDPSWFPCTCKPPSPLRASPHAPGEIIRCTVLLNPKWAAWSFHNHILIFQGLSHTCAFTCTPCAQEANIPSHAVKCSSCCDPAFPCLARETKTQSGFRNSFEACINFLAKCHLKKTFPAFLLEISPACVPSVSALLRGSTGERYPLT